MKLVNASKEMMSRKYFTCYSKDILDCFFSAEKLNIKIKGRSDQLEIRSPVVELLQSFAKHQGYSLATLHLAVFILDVYMDNYVLSDFFEHQKLIGLVCLLLAAKSEDLDELVPTIKDLLKLCDMSADLEVDLRFKSELTKMQIQTAYRKFASMYSKLEFLVFESMEFNTIRPTAITFLNIFQGALVTKEDLVGGDIKDLNVLRDTAADYLKQFLGVIIKDVDFFNVLPSLLAASIVGVVRKLINIEKYWNDQLVNLTSYNINQIRPMMIMLVDKRDQYAYVQQDDDMSSGEDTIMKDSGFCSITTSDSDSSEEDVPSIKRRLISRAKIVA